MAQGKPTTPSTGGKLLNVRLSPEASKQIAYWCIENNATRGEAIEAAIKLLAGTPKRAKKVVPVPVEEPSPPLEVLTPKELEKALEGTKKPLEIEPDWEALLSGTDPNMQPKE